MSNAASAQTEETLSVTREVFASFEAHDLDRFRTLLAEDAELRDPSTQQVQHGKEAVAGTIEATLAAFPDLRPEVTNLFANGEQAVAEVARYGTHTGALDLPGGRVEPTGRDVRLPECIIMRVKGGKLTSITVYLDRLHVMQELGLAPPPPEEEG